MRIILSTILFSLMAATIGCQNPSALPAQAISTSQIQSQIVGTWSAKKFEGVSGDVSAVFRANGTATLERTGVVTQNANWRAQPGCIVLTQNSGMPASSLDRWNIIELDQNKLVFRRGGNSSDKKVTLTRVGR